MLSNSKRVPVEHNYWGDEKCAKAFWSQQELPPYKRLVRATMDWADPRPDQTWLDLGCGSGALSREIWQRTGGGVAKIVAVDLAGINASAYESLRQSLAAPADRIQFIEHDFSEGLGLFADESFDHTVSGLSIAYAQSYSKGEGRWTTAAYDRVLSEVARVLRPGGRFVFSVPVPHPSWARVSLEALPGYLTSKRPLRLLKRSLRMMRYAAWLTQQAGIGRFHYLPSEVVRDKLSAAGFERIDHRTAYAGQAFVFRCTKGRTDG
jgi:ubiquinone/menaquinone biosynthesis C-methylase UbiE